MVSAVTNTHRVGWTYRGLNAGPSVINVSLQNRNHTTRPYARRLCGYADTNQRSSARAGFASCTTTERTTPICHFVSSCWISSSLEIVSTRKGGPLRVVCISTLTLAKAFSRRRILPLQSRGKCLDSLPVRSKIMYLTK